MNKTQARNQLINYFKSNQIDYKLINESEKVQAIDSIDHIHLLAKVPEVYGKHLETCLRFTDDYLYSQTYFCQPIVNISSDDEVFRASRIINFVNHNLVYDCDKLFDRKLVMNEETGDIYSGIQIRYELMSAYFFDTINYILNFQIQILSDICVPLFLYIKGENSFFEAAYVGINYNLLGKPIPFIND